MPVYCTSYVECLLDNKLLLRCLLLPLNSIVKQQQQQQQQQHHHHHHNNNNNNNIIGRKRDP